MKLLDKSEIFQVLESPVKWIGKFVQSVGTEKALTHFEYLKYGKFGPDLDRNESEPDNFVESLQFSYHLPELYRFVFYKINLASAYIFVGEFDKALGLIKEVRETCKLLNGDHRTVQKVVKHVLSVIEWKINVLEKYSKTTDVDLSHDEIESFSSEWNTLAYRKKFRAVIVFMRACLDLSLGASKNDTIIQLKNVVLLNKSYFSWQYYLYRMLRCTRIEKVRAEHIDISPEDEEKTAIENCFKLRPGILLNLYWMSEFLIRSLRTLKKDISENKTECISQYQEMYDKCLKLLRDAEEICKIEKLQNWTERVCLKKYSLMQYSIKDTEKQADEKTLFLENCKTEYQSSSVVLNTLGLHYQMEARFLMGALQKSIETARENYKQAIEKNPKDFEILMNYVDFLNFIPFVTRRDYINLFEITEKAIEENKGNEYEADLHILKGCIIWMYNPELCRRLEENRDALDIWIDVWKDFPEKRKKLLESIRNPPINYSLNGRRLKGKINHLDFVLELNKMRKELEEDVTNRDEATLQIIFDLWLMGEKMDLPEPPPEPVEKQGISKNFRSRENYKPPHQRSSEQQNGNARPRFGPSISDMDDNWRK